MKTIKRAMLIVFILSIAFYMGKTAEAMASPVGLLTVAPDTLFFEVAKETHGNYVMYYDYSQKEFMFVRDSKPCFVSTMQFRKNYIKKIKAIKAKE